MIFIIGIPIYTFMLMVLATSVISVLMIEDWTNSNLKKLSRDLLDLLSDREWWTDAGILAIIAVGIQAIFVIPVLWNRPPKAPQSRSLKISLIIAAAVASSLTFGLLFAFAEFSRTVLEYSVESDGSDGGVIVTAIIVGSWVFWSALLLIFCKGIWADRLLGRVVGLLIAGTLLEALIVLPLDIMVRRRTDCYCFSGTLIALCFSAMATMWLAGPGIVIALMSKKHRRWRESHCFRCGYAKGPSPGPVCPECGFDWSDAKKAGAKPSNPTQKGG